MNFKKAACILLCAMMIFSCSTQQAKDFGDWWKAVRPIADDVLNFFTSPQFKTLASAIGNAAGADQKDLDKAFFWLDQAKQGFELTAETIDMINTLQAKVEKGEQLTPEEATKLQQLMLDIAKYAASKRNFDPELLPQAEKRYENFVKEREAAKNERLDDGPN